MTDLRQAAQQALEALEKYATDETPEGWHAIAAITALRAALAEPVEQEPVACSDAYDMIDHFLRNNLNSDADYAEYSAALDSIYSAPAQRKPLTEEEILTCFDESVEGYVDITDAEVIDFARAIEQEHGIGGGNE